MARNRVGEHDTPKNAGLRREWAERVAQRMDELGLTQTDLAEALGCSQSSISRWFRTGLWSIPEGVHMIQLAPLLRLNAHWMMTGEGPRTPPGDQATDAKFADGSRAALTAVKLFIEAELAKLALRAPAAAPADQIREERELAQRRLAAAEEAERHAHAMQPRLRKGKRRVR